MGYSIIYPFRSFFSNRYFSKMMTLSFLLFSFSIFTVSIANEIEIQNNCPFTVWPGIQGRIGHSHLENGGFELGANMTRKIKSPLGWSGSIWGRTQCNSLGKCVTGDCGKIILRF